MTSLFGLGRKKNDEQESTGTGTGTGTGLGSGNTGIGHCTAISLDDGVALGFGIATLESISDLWHGMACSRQKSNQLGPQVHQNETTADSMLHPVLQAMALLASAAQEVRRLRT